LNDVSQILPLPTLVATATKSENLAENWLEPGLHKLDNVIHIYILSK